MGRLLGGLKKGIAGLILAACTTLPLPTATSTPIPYPTDPPASTQTPTAGATPSAVPTPTTPLLGPTPTPNANLHVGGLATVVRDGLRRWADPTTRDNARAYPRLAADSLVYLVDGPRTVDGVDYWQVWPSEWEQESLASPLGWAAARSADTEQLLYPYQPNCPEYSEPFTASDIAPLSGVEQLSCFGSSEIVIRGTVHCRRPVVDGDIGGAPYMDSYRSCSVGGMGIQGAGVYELLDEPDRVDEVRGFYEVRAHFDDLGAQRCHAIPFGASLELPGAPEPGAVMICRSHLVATSATLAEGPDMSRVGQFESGDLVTVAGGVVYGVREERPIGESSVWLYEGAVPYLVGGGGFLGNYEFWYLWDERGQVGTFSDADQTDGGWLLPVALDCPASNGVLEVEAVIELSGLERIACFGEQTITVRGSLHCFREWADYVVGGVPWLDDEKHCQLEDAVWVYGQEVTRLLPDGEESFRAAVQLEGHFDDPAARGCVSRTLGSDPPPRFPGEPEAVIACRQMFVVTSVTFLD